MIIPITTVLACLPMTVGQADRVDSEQFASLIDRLHSPIEDLSFAYEGRSDVFRADHGDEQVHEGSGMKQYQGLYSFRSDGSSLIDIYFRSDNPEAPQLRSKYALLDGELQELRHVPDQVINTQPTVRPGGNGYALTTNASPNKFLYLWFFQSLDDLQNRNYTFEGWEAVDGHNCMRVKLDYFPGPWVGPMPIIRFWIDASRGGHPLKIESELGGKLAWQTSDIRLEQFDLPRDGQVWLPISGRTDYFRWGTTSHSSPVMTETYQVVPGSVRLNQGLTNGHFSISQDPRAASTREFRRWRDAFDQAVVDERRNRPRLDPAEIQEQLDQQLVEVNQQERMLTASSPAQRHRWWTSLSQISLVAFGVTAIVIAFVIQRRGSA